MTIAGSIRPTWQLLLCLCPAAFGSACAKTVDLGHDQSSGDASTLPDDPDPYLPYYSELPNAGTVVHESPSSTDSVDAIAVDERYLYLALHSPTAVVLRRCQPQACPQTVADLATVPQVFPPYADVQMELVRVETRLWWVIENTGTASTCTLPDCNDLQIVIANLPQLFSRAFADDALYFALKGKEEPLYRCSLPGCVGGPAIFGPVGALAEIVEGQSLYWRRGNVIKRIDVKTGQTAESWVAGDRLVHNDASPEPLDGGVDNSMLGFENMRISLEDGWLYSGPGPCFSSSKVCSDAIVRWPMPEGPIETMPLPDRTNWAGLFGGEVVTIAPEPIYYPTVPEPTSYPRYSLFSRRFEAGAETRRFLGPTYGLGGGHPAADAQYIYWIEKRSAQTAPGSVKVPDRVRRTSRLPR